MKTLQSATLLIQLDIPAAVPLADAQAQLAQACARLVAALNPATDSCRVADLDPVQPNPRNGGFQARIAFHGAADWLTIDMAADLKQKTLRALTGTAWRILEQKVYRQWLVDEYAPIFV